MKFRIKMIQKLLIMRKRDGELADLTSVYNTPTFQISIADLDPDTAGAVLLTIEQALNQLTGANDESAVSAFRFHVEEVPERQYDASEDDD